MGGLILGFFANGESVDETYIPALENASCAYAWISSKAQDSRGTGRAACAASERTGSSRCVIHNYRLPRTARLSDDEAIKGFRSTVQSLRGRWFVVRRIGNTVGYPRLTVRVGKKAVKAAVARNRIRRLVRETFRLRRPDLPALDFLISVRADLTDVTMSEARRDLERLLPPRAS